MCKDLEGTVSVCLKILTRYSFEETKENTVGGGLYSWRRQFEHGPGCRLSRDLSWFYSVPPGE